MKEKDDILKAFRAGTLAPQDQAQLEAWIADGTLDLEELELYSSTLDYLHAAEESAPTARMDGLFYAELEKQKALTKKANRFGFPSVLSWNFIQRWVMPFAAAVLLFWGGWYWGIQNPENIDPSDEAQIASALINTEDVSEKIHLVSSTKIADETDRKIIDALLFTLSNDESNNVRLACIDVLMNYSYLPVVRKGLISSISHQNSPVVLANLAEAIAAGGQKMDKEDIRSRIDKQLPPPVQQSMKEVLINL